MTLPYVSADMQCDSPPHGLPESMCHPCLAQTSLKSPCLHIHINSHQGSV